MSGENQLLIQVTEEKVIDDEQGGFKTEKSCVD